ncbi:autotransporter domain-containing protein [Marinagarivorans algicola]|uniref:autotransporter domain-containing protein n=1 Tax=Marinagarivorans algicola TaxID=1513270 RepID=UPI003736612A
MLFALSVLPTLKKKFVRVYFSILTGLLAGKRRPALKWQARYSLERLVIYSSCSVVLASALYAVPIHALLNAENDSRTVPAETPILIDVLSNDVSDDGALKIIQFSQPANGSVMQASGGLRYQPKQNFVGYDRFTYRIQNASGVASATVLISVGNVPAQATMAPLAIVAMASASVATHRRALNQFARLGASFAALNRHQIPLAGLGAGDSLMPAGGLFVSAHTDASQQKETVYQPAYQGDSSGFTVGADFLAGRRWFLGGAIGYSQGKADFDVHNTTLLERLDNTETSLIGMMSYQGDVLLAQAQLGISRHAFDWRVGDGFGRNNESSGYWGHTSGASQFAYASVDYAFAAQGWQLMPSVGVLYERSSIHDSAARGQVFNGGTNNHWQAVVSLHVDYAATFAWGVLLPQLSIGSERIISSQATAHHAPDFARQQAIYDDQTQLTLEAGLAWILPRGLSGFVIYQRLMAHAYYQNDGLQAGLRWEF